ncbi:MAG: beta-ketoacyl-[acyl-carrier-protein] synthase family protein [Pseudomonadota bacterium]
MTPLPITHYTLTSALGRGKAAHADALREGRGGLRNAAFENCTLACWTGAVDGLETPLTGEMKDWDCRNNRLAELGLRQDGFLEAVTALRARAGATRIGVFIGTSTAGVQQTERAYRERDRAANQLPEWFDYRTSQNTYSVAGYVRQRLQLQSVAIAVSTACSSSAKVFACAARALATGLCDAAVVGGVDSLCLTTLHGFNALQLVSPEPCRPADVARRGISIGEAAGFAILEKQGKGLLLRGYGESADAHHMSAPEPEGRGANEAMRAALARADLDTSAVDYVHLHGTATPANDLAEDKAVCAVFGKSTPCSSTKGYFGHALGAAGIVGATVAMLVIEHGFLPHSLNTQSVDPAIKGAVLLKRREDASVRNVITNSFGFGGNNCSLIIGSAT